MPEKPFLLMFTASDLGAAREWISDCVWRDIQDDDDVAQLTAEQIERGIEKHFDGGRRGFLAAISPTA